MFSLYSVNGESKSLSPCRSDRTSPKCRRYKGVYIHVCVGVRQLRGRVQPVHGPPAGGGAEWLPCDPRRAGGTRRRLQP